MKALVSTIGMATALSLLVVVRVGGQEIPDATASEMRQEAKKLQDEARSNAQRMQAAARDAEAEAKRGIDQVRQGLDQYRRQLETAATPVPAGAPGDAGIRQRLQAVIGTTRGTAGNTLVIRSSEADPKAQVNLQEDLTVMSRVLDNALGQSATAGGARRVMGVNVVYTLGQSPVRSLYLDGYGAVFFLNVNFPLLPPPAKAEPPKEEPKTDSAWEEARRELYGQPSEMRPNAVTEGSSAEPYDADKVTQLKDTLLEALKAAANIRDLKPDDFVTVCVFGGASAGTTGTRPPTTMRIVPNNSDEAFTLWSGASAVATDRRTGQTVITTTGAGDRTARGSTMSIRVKKSDADAFAKDKLTLEEFRKRAKIATYAGGAR